MRACNDSYLERIAKFAGDSRRALAQLAELIAGNAGPDRAQVAAEYELYLLAARRRRLPSFPERGQILRGKGPRSV